MPKLAAILSVMAITAVTVSSLSLEALPYKSNLLQVTNVAPSPTSDGVVNPDVLCDDILKATANASSLQVHTCIVPAAPPPSRTIDLAPEVAPTLLCAGSALAPGLDDAQSLCFGTGITDPVTISAPPSGSCRCLQWHLNSAVFRACNCNTCSAVMFSGTRSECQSICTNCVEHGVGGYESTTGPNAFTVLFLANSSPAFPVPDACT